MMSNQLIKGYISYYCFLHFNTHCRSSSSNYFRPLISPLFLKRVFHEHGAISQERMIIIKLNYINC